MHSDHIKKIITAGLAIATITGGVVYNSSVAMAETIPQKENPQEVVESKSDKNKPIVSGDVTTKENVTIDNQGVTVGDKGTITVKDGSITFPASSNNIIERKEEKRNLDSVNNIRSTTSRHSLPVISSKNPDVSIDILEIDEDTGKADCLITVRNQQSNKKIKVDLKLYEHHRFQRWTHTTNKSFNLTTNDQGEASDDFSFDIYDETSIHPGSLIYNADTVIEQLPSEEHNTDPSIDPSTDPSTEHNTDPSPISKDPNDTKDKIVQFKDQNLKNALLYCMKKQGLIADNATEINEEQALKLTNLKGLFAQHNLNSIASSIEGREIKDLSGIKYFKNLTTLSLCHNWIHDFSELSELHKLEYLDISTNNIGYVGINPEEKHETITINDHIGNTLTNLPNTIKYLNADNINLSDLAWLKHMTSIQNLNISNNKIVDISSISNMPNLKELNLSDNQIGNLQPLKGLPMLQKLKLHKNKISDIHLLNSLNNLQELDLSENNISIISLTKDLNNLKKINLSKNNISTIFQLKQLENLQDLDLSNNNISDINLLSDLISTRKLKYIGLSGNHINDIQSLKRISDKYDDINIDMEGQVLPTYDFTGKDVSLNYIVKPTDSTLYDQLDFTDEDRSYYYIDSLEPLAKIEDFFKYVYTKNHSEESGANVIAIKKIPHSKKLDIVCLSFDDFFGSDSVRYSGTFILDFTKYIDQLINRIQQTGASPDKQQKIIDKINSGFGDIKEIETDISNLEKEKSDDTYVFVSTQGKSENEKTEILKKINFHQEIADPTFTEVGTSLQFHVSMQNLKPKSNVKISYTISNSNTKEISGVSTSTGTFEFSIPIEATGTPKVKFNINDFQGWIKKTDIDTNKDKIVQFKDEHFKNQVLKQMHDSKLIAKDSKEIHESDINKLVSLTLNTERIKTFEDFNLLKNVTSVKLKGKNTLDRTLLKTVDDNEKIKYLDLSDNGYTDNDNVYNTIKSNLPKLLNRITKFEKGKEGINLDGNHITCFYEMEATKKKGIGSDMIINPYIPDPRFSMLNQTATIKWNKDNPTVYIPFAEIKMSLDPTSSEIYTVKHNYLISTKGYDSSNNLADYYRDEYLDNNFEIGKKDKDGTTPISLVTYKQSNFVENVDSHSEGKVETIPEKPQFTFNDKNNNYSITYEFDATDYLKNLQQRLKDSKLAESVKTKYLKEFDGKTKDNTIHVKEIEEALHGKIVNTVDDVQTQTDDISGQLKKLLDESTDIKTSDNYKNADKEKQDLYNNAITSGQAIYDKLSSTPEQVNDAAQAIQSALSKLNGDSKSKTTLEGLQQEQTKLQRQIEQIKADKNKSEEEKNKEITKLNGQIIDLGKQIEQLNKDKQSLQDQLQQVQNNLSNVTAQFEQFKKDKKTTDEKNQEQISSLNSQIELLNKDKQNLQGEIDTKTSQISSLNKQLEQLKQDKTQSEQQKQTEIDKLNGQISQLTKDKQELQSQLNTANNTIQNLNNELEKAKQQHTADTSTIERLTGELQQAKNTLEQLKQDKTQSEQQKQAEIDKLNEKITELGKQIEQLTKDKSSLADQFKQSQQQVGDLQGKLNKIQQQGSLDKLQIEKLQQQISSLNNQLEQLKQDKTQSDQQKQAEIDKLNGKITELGKQIEQLTKDKQSLQSQLDVANGKIQTLSNELEKAKQQGLADVSTIQNLNKQITELQNKLAKLQNDKTLNDQQKQAEIDKLNNEIKDLKKQIGQLTKDKNTLQNQISQLNKQIEELTNKVNSCPLVDVEKLKDYERIKIEFQQAKQAFEQLKQNKQKSDKEKQEEINQLKKKIEELTQKLTSINSGAIVKPLINEKPEFDLERYKKEHPEEFTTVPSENGELPVEPSTPTVNENNSDGSDTTTTKPNSSTERKKSTTTDQENQTEKKSPVATSSTKDKQTLPKTSDPTAPLGLLGFITTALGLFGFKKKH